MPAPPSARPSAPRPPLPHAHVATIGPELPDDLAVLQAELLRLRRALSLIWTATTGSAPDRSLTTHQLVAAGHRVRRECQERLVQRCRAEREVAQARRAGRAIASKPA